MFVCKHGGQSEIILRVKQGDNPTFGFLMPNHHLHAYIRFLVDHPELFQSDGNLQMEERKENNEDKKPNFVGEALSLLGSVYGSGEDEDGTTDDKPESNKNLFVEKVNTVNSVASQGSGRLESSPGTGEKDNAGSKQPLPSQKVKVLAIKKNPSVNISRAGNGATMKKEDGSSSFSAAMEKLKDSALGTSSKVIVEPPSDIKRTIDKIVEFIAKNGKPFEATLVEQDSKHGRFPFLLPSNQYPPFYLKVLQKSQELARMQPKIGKMDIDYQVLYDVFFKYQTKSKLISHGDLYYEGMEFEVKLREMKPGTLSQELKEALGMPEDVPPPWLINMQRYGPLPSYPHLKIPRLNSLIPPGAKFGYQPGGWGKHPIDEAPTLWRCL